MKQHSSAFTPATTNERQVSRSTLIKVPLILKAETKDNVDMFVQHVHLQRSLSEFIPSAAFMPINKLSSENARKSDSSARGRRRGAGGGVSTSLARRCPQPQIGGGAALKRRR